MHQSKLDERLIARIAQGEHAALKTLYMTYHGNLIRFVRHYLVDPQDAADVVHETLLEVWRRAEHFAGRSSVKSWMFSIARNKAIDLNRKASRSIPDEPPEEESDPCTMVEAFQDSERVHLCLENLSIPQKRAIHLAFYEDFSYPEIAKLENCPVGTVKTRIMAAKSALRYCLSKS